MYLYRFSVQKLRNTVGTLGSEVSLSPSPYFSGDCCALGRSTAQLTIWSTTRRTLALTAQSVRTAAATGVLPGA